jgi:hypothetical protein
MQGGHAKLDRKIAKLLGRGLASRSFGAEKELVTLPSTEMAW